MAPQITGVAVLRSLGFGVLLILSQIALRVGSVARTRKLLSVFAGNRQLDDGQLARAKPVTKDVTRVSRRRPLTSIGVDCLAESLVLESALLRQGIDAAVHIGVNPSDKSDAHAWVEVDGVPLNDSLDVAERMLSFDKPLPPVRR